MASYISLRSVFCFIIIIYLPQCLSIRYLVFPKGSKFFVRLNVREDIFDYTTTFVHVAAFRITWDLPEHPQHKNKFTRRDLRNGFQELLDRHNINGEKCIEKFLCESQLGNQDNVILKIMSLMFGSDNEGLACVNLHDCPISIWDWIPSTILNETQF